MHRFLWALKLNSGEKACLLFVDHFINSEAARLFIFPTSVLGSSFVTVFARCCVLYTSSEMSTLVCTVTMYLWKQWMSNILHWILSFIPVGYLSAWIMPARRNFTTLRGRRDFSAGTFIYIALIFFQSNLYLLDCRQYWWERFQNDSLVTWGWFGIDAIGILHYENIYKKNYLIVVFAVSVCFGCRWVVLEPPHYMLPF